MLNSAASKSQLKQSGNWGNKCLKDEATRLLPKRCEGVRIQWEKQFNGLHHHKLKGEMKTRPTHTYPPAEVTDNILKNLIVTDCVTGMDKKVMAL